MWLKHFRVRGFHSSESSSYTPTMVVSSSNITRLSGGLVFDIPILTPPRELHGFR